MPSYIFQQSGTAEISRAQLWQWIRYPRGMLEDGRKVTLEVFRESLTRELAQVREEIGEQQ